MIGNSDIVPQANSDREPFPELSSGFIPPATRRQGHDLKEQTREEIVARPLPRRRLPGT